jgi:peptidoglycan/LPS O-acetylase OafA/YrhL
VCSSDLPGFETVAWEAWIMWLGSLIFTLLAASFYDRLIDAPIQKVLNARLFGVRARPAPHQAPEPSA